jgi:hypothetical protein
MLHFTRVNENEGGIFLCLCSQTHCLLWYTYPRIRLVGWCVFEHRFLSLFVSHFLFSYPHTSCCDYISLLDVCQIHGACFVAFALFRSPIKFPPQRCPIPSLSVPLSAIFSFMTLTYLTVYCGPVYLVSDFLLECKFYESGISLV